MKPLSKKEIDELYEIALEKYAEEGSNEGPTLRFISNEWVLDETENCDLWDKSACCTASFWLESDICSACKEHASSCCEDCEDFDICLNFDKVTI